MEYSKEESLYGRHPFTIKDESWMVILDVVNSVLHEEIKQGSKSIDERLLKSVSQTYVSH